MEGPGPSHPSLPFTWACHLQVTQDMMGNNGRFVSSVQIAVGSHLLPVFVPFQVVSQLQSSVFMQHADGGCRPGLGAPRYVPDAAAGGARDLAQPRTWAPGILAPKGPHILSPPGQRNPLPPAGHCPPQRGPSTP